LDGASSLVGVVVGRAVGKQSVEEEDAARLERDGDRIAAHDFVVADLPVPSLEVDPGPELVAALEQMHATVVTVASSRAIHTPTMRVPIG
jgi:hypothetical protein